MGDRFPFEEYFSPFPGKRSRHAWIAESYSPLHSANANRITIPCSADRLSDGNIADSAPDHCRTSLVTAVTVATIAAVLSVSGLQ